MKYDEVLPIAASESSSGTSRSSSFNDAIIIIVVCTRTDILPQEYLYSTQHDTDHHLYSSEMVEMSPS